MKRIYTYALLIALVCLSASLLRARQDSLDGKTVSDYTKDLTSPEWEVRKKAVQSLQVMAFNQRVAMSECISSGKPKKECVRLLEVKNVVPALIAQLKQESNSEIKTDLVRTLGEIGGDASDAVPVLLATLESGDPHLHQQASMALVRIALQDRSVIPLIEARMEDKNPETRKKIVHLIGLIGIQVTSVLPTVAKGLEDQDFEVRWVTVNALGEIGKTNPAVIPYLLKALEDQSGRVRAVAAFELGQIGSPAHVPAITRALEKEKDPGARDTIKNAIKQIESRMK